MAVLDYSLLSRASRYNLQGDMVSAPAPGWWNMYCHWELVDDLLAGTWAMRNKGERWLPKEPNESQPKYKVRLARSVLYAVLRDTVEKLSGEPFVKPVTVKGKFDDEMLGEIEKKADDEGRDLTLVCDEAFTWMASHGHVHLLTNYAQQPDPSKPLNKADERKAGFRPMIKVISPEDMIGWRWTYGAGGEKRLTQIRYREFVEEPDGRWGASCHMYIWVWNEDGSWEKYDATQRPSQPKKLASGKTTFPGIPLRTAYAKRTGFMTSEPPLRDLAELNLCHWQSFSDQRHILRFARSPMIARTGITKSEKDEDVNVAPTNVFSSTSQMAKYYIVEHTGKAIEAGEQDLKRLEDRMEVLGAQPLMESSADNSATGDLLHEGKNRSSMQRWCRNLENAIRGCYEDAATWIGKELPEDFGVDIFSEFSMLSGNPATLEFLHKCRQTGDLTRVTFLKEIKKRGALSADVDPETEADDAEMEAPPMAINPFAKPGDPNAPPPKPGDKPGDKPNAPPIPLNPPNPQPPKK